MMEIKRNEIELMAPVGSYESLMAAIQAGADSVYFGVEQLNMRAKSTNNFTTEDLQNIVKICNEHKIKSYLVVNTIIYDHDIRLMKQLVDIAKASGVTAIIASDQAVINYAFSQGVELHISTQVNVSNIETLKFYAHFADVMVLARELSLKQVAKITEAIEKEQIKGPSGKLIRVEIFAHGALCMAVSGKCYLSLHEQNSSANRGACLQTCRKSYIVTEKETGYELEIDNEYIMSPKDLMIIDFLDQVKDAGVSVIKLEGRARSPEYVATVTRAYREAIDALNAGVYSRDKVEKWVERLSTVYNRGFWGGYYLGKKLGEWSQPGNQAKFRKMYIGRGKHYYPKAKVGVFQIEAFDVKVGDKVLIIGPESGVKEMELKEIYVNDRPGEKARKGDLLSVKIDTKIRPSDKLYKLVENK